MSHNPVCPLQPLQVCRISWIIVSLHACSDIRSSSISLAAICIMHVPSGFFVHIPHLVFARRFITHETIFPGSIPAPRTSSIHTFCSISKFFIYASFICRHTIFCVSVPNINIRNFLIFPLPIPFVSILDIILDGIIHTGCIIIIPVVPVLIIIAIHVDIIVTAIVRIMRMAAIILAVRTAARTI